MNKLDEQYKDLLADIMENGYRKGDRTGTGTISVFGRQIRHKMSDGFPLLTTKKMAWKGIVTELIWFLRGDTNIKYLLEQKNLIWVGDAYKKYANLTSLDADVQLTKNEFIEKILNDSDFCKKWGDLGPVYGKQWRKWEKYGFRGVQNGALDAGMITREEAEREMYIDQIQNAIDDLNNNPDSRRIIVNAWNPGEIENMTLPPCHQEFQFYTRELSHSERCELVAKKNNKNISYTDKLTDQKLDALRVPKREISLMWKQRSVDTFLGLPFNIASYGLLLEIFARLVNMVPGELIGNLGDTHIYSDHVEQVKEQISRTSFKLPTLDIKLHFKNKPSFAPEHWLAEDFEISNYEYHPAIKAPLSN